MLWSIIPMRLGHTKINARVKNIYMIELYSILRFCHHQQKMIDFKCLLIANLKKMVPHLLLQVSVSEPCNSMISPTEEGGLKEAIEEENNITINDSTLCNIIPPQLKNMSECYKVICGCQFLISDKIVHSSLLSLCYRYLKKLKTKATIQKIEGLVKWSVLF